MADAFSSSSEIAMLRQFDVQVKKPTPLDKLDEFYQVNKTCDFICQNHFDKVALQFPDDLLHESTGVAAEIERTTQTKVFILGDTSYGSCCVDEVAAEHVGADCLVHYGHACLSPTKRLPVMYIFDRGHLDVDRCTSAFTELYPDTQANILLFYDVRYTHAMDDVMTKLSAVYPNVVLSQIAVESECWHNYNRTESKSEQDTNEESYFGRKFILKRGLSIKDFNIFYVGQEGSTLINLMMTLNRCSFTSFDPNTSSGRVESANINRALMKRYYAIERAKDANVVGILVGTLGVSDYLSILQQLKDVIHAANKKTYVFAMGKINVAKLANFLEIDIFVLIACPENSLLDSADFYRPVVTPFEMEMACNPNRKWTEEYVTDFRHLLPGGQSHVLLSGAQEEETETNMSLITGSMRSCKMNTEEVISENSSLVLRNQTLTVANTNSAASFLANRSWRGLEQKLGETPVMKAVTGRKGIAIAYEDEGAAS
ncbi:2-(3-amino-3-carboxypropyl)histidine synthase subunit 2 [Nerophis ophidion]|uniref:2-(3-amino-3-carboxypropyl)histidine synthase subunit 2 n=1 Tax=Nerophis ophidion TaxID=159077 RepID=UPI002AE01DCD|nr:2-(3-amino-3-carboxypropyl)histidine synthase subunit 2 [Nerophis ophidion]XP_061778121.1 2-(3-amino-3-carboxypropyl)histidine synthase subunit 2 [Nerophis ophidion]